MPPVYRFALRLSRNPHVAEDLTQETMLRAWRHRDRPDDPGAARSWLFAITANLWRDHLRRGRLRCTAPFDATDEPTVTHDAPSPERRDDLDRALALVDALPDRQREVLHLCICEALPTAAVARILEISEQAVRSNLSLARTNLRERALRDAAPDTGDAS